MDWVRSCYSTSMVMDQAGGTYPVDWYFVPAGTALFTPQHPVSLNWAKPEYGQETIGEVPGALRPYRKGARPSYVPAAGTFPQVGTDGAFSLGAPAPLAAVPPLDFAARRRYPPDPAPIFPPLVTPPGTATLTSNTSAYAAQGWDGRAWDWDGPAPKKVTWDTFGDCNADTNLWPCLPNTYTLFVSVNGFQRSTALRCLSYSAGTGTSTWDDPLGGGLAAGEVLTLVAL